MARNRAQTVHARRVSSSPLARTMQSSLAADTICPTAGLRSLCRRGARAPARPLVPSQARIQGALASGATAVTNAEDGGGGAARPLTAVIIGGGPGGLAACVALRRIGIDAHVYERATALDPNAGQGLHLRPRRQLARHHHPSTEVSSSRSARVARSPTLATLKPAY